MSRSQFRTFSTAEQTPLSQPLTFEARSVTVTNLSASWCSFPDADSYPVPPWTYGAVLRLQGTSQARVNWNTPSGLTPATVAGGTVTTIWDEEAIPPSNGQQVVIPSQQVPCLITKVVSLTGNASATVGKSIFTMTSSNDSAVVQVALPAGANSVIIAGGATDGATPLYNIILQGVESNSLYLDTGLFNTTPAFDIPSAAVVSSASDQHLQLTLTNNGGNHSFTFQVVASFGTQAVYVQGSGGATPISVTTPVGEPSFAIPGIQPTTGGTSLLKLAVGTYAIAGGGTATVVTGAVGKAFYLYSYSFTVSPGDFAPAGQSSYRCDFLYNGGGVDTVQMTTESATGNLTPGRMSNNNTLGLRIPGATGGDLTLSAPGRSVLVGGTVAYALY